MIHVIIDLEMNPVQKKFKGIRRIMNDEIIEIGAVKLNEKYEKIGEFQVYVRPEYGEITKHITKLTGITNEIVSDKATFSSEFKNFMDWIGTWDMTLYSWSNSDIKQLKSECSFKIPDFDVKKLSSHWLDLQKAFDDKIGLHSSLALKHAVGAMNRDFEGVQHTALADAANTAAILALMQDEKKFLEVMKPVIELLNPKNLSQSIGDLYPELMNLKFD